MVDFEFFNKLTEEEKNFLKTNAKYIEIDKNTILFYQGDICQDILLLQEGKVKLSIHGDLNEEISLYEIKKGEQCIVNTSSTLSQTKAIATAQTVTPIKGWLIPSSTFEELILKSPFYQKYIFSLFSIKFNALTTLIEDIKFKRLDSRIFDYLKKWDEPIINITHDDIANELGTSRVVVSRILKDLENKGFIKLSRKKIEIL